MKIATVGMVVALALSACSQVDSVSSEEAPLVAARDPGAVTDMICASQDQLWYDYPESEIAYYVCTYPTGTCAPVYVTVLEADETPRAAQARARKRMGPSPRRARSSSRSAARRSSSSAAT